MIAIGPATVLATFVLFCRIGTCIMLMPGFSSARVPGRVRLFIAIGITLTLAPLLVGDVEEVVAASPVQGLPAIIVSEMLIGAMIGILGQLFVLALETLGTAAAMAIGYGPIPGTAVEGDEPQPALVSLLTISAIVLLFISGQDREVLRGLVASYSTLPVAQLFDIQIALTRIADVLVDAFLAALRISSPFIIYAIVINFAFGLANKLTPQIPVYFISLPFVIAGGLLILYLAVPDMLRLFVDGFASWAARG